MKKHLFCSLGTLACISLYAIDRDSSDYYFQKGIEFKTGKLYLQASNAFDKSLQFDTKKIAAHLENAYVNIEMRKTDKAMACFVKVLELDPQNNIAINELMQLYYNYRQFTRAKELALKCASCIGAEKILAMCNYQNEDYMLAVTGFKNYLAKNPTDAEATYTFARCYLDMDDYKNAIIVYNKAILLEPEKNNWAYELGLIYYNQNDFKNAVLYFTKAADKGYSQKSDFKENLGYALIYSGQFEQGEKILLDLLAKKPNNKEMIRDIAEAYYNGKMYDKSLGFCQQLMQLDMKDGKALYQAGLCFQKLGQKDKGQAMCDKAIEFDPSLASMRQKQMGMGF